MDIRISVFAGLLSALAAAAGPIRAEADPPAPDPIGRGIRLLAAGHPDSAVGPFLEAHAEGMPKDSLYYFLAEIARRKTALDTAMGFNLAVGTPAPGAFRDSVLAQRYRLYVASGLTSDAAALRDSLSTLPDASPRRLGRLSRITARLGTGWFRESSPAAFAYPFRIGLGGYEPEGFQHRARGGFEFPIHEGGRMAWTGGMEMQALKSYAKDSVDYRLGAALRAERPGREGWSAGVGAEAGRITGSGWVGACKAEGGWLSLRPAGLALIMGGIATEWDERGRQRFQSAWLTGFRDATSGSGRGFTAMLSLTGLRLDPISETLAWREIYVDDVSLPRPVHYQDATYSDSLPSTGRGTFARYTSAAGSVSTVSNAPQSCLTAAPSIAFALPLGSGVIAELTLAASGSWYPEPYRWDRAPLPQGDPATGDFLGFARNRADGRDYAAYLIQGNGGFTETYGAAPVVRRERTRLDGQAEAEFGVRRSFAGWGTLAASVGARRNATTLEGEAPVWIPEWYAGAALRWSGEWAW